MITGNILRQIRKETFKASHQYEEKFVQIAQNAAEDGRPYYANMTNSAVQDTYRYLCRFSASVARLNTGKEPPEIKILDWGGGKGMATYFLEQLGFNVTLYETDQFPHDDYWKTYSMKVKTSDGKKLPFKDNQFDIIVGFGVLEHVPYEDDALKEINRVLKNDGLFLCFNLPSKYGLLHYITAWRGVQYHDRLYSANEIRWLLKRAGFNIVGRSWRRQVFPKNAVHYHNPAFWEKIDLWLCRYTPVRYFATSLEFVARKQYTYTSIH
jgi:ubiquinone/menaquinone biosynthesis C-methylase UbiE